MTYSSSLYGGENVIPTLAMKSDFSTIFILEGGADFLVFMVIAGGEKRSKRGTKKIVNNLLKMS